MTDVLTQPWPYAAAVVLAAVLLGCRVRLWGPGFGLEADPPGRRRKRGR